LAEACSPGFGKSEEVYLLLGTNAVELPGLKLVKLEVLKLEPVDAPAAGKFTFMFSKVNGLDAGATGGTV